MVLLRQVAGDSEYWLRGSAEVGRERLGKQLTG